MRSPIRHVILFLFLVSVRAGANPCLLVDSYRDLDNFQRYIHKIGGYKSLPPRMTPDNYAQSHNLGRKAFNNQISASGKIRCGGASASANLTMSSMVLTTAGHVVCESPVPIKACEFIYVYDGVSKHVPVASIFDKGYDCSSETPPTEDWAVLKLKDAAAGPLPYKINPNLVNTMPYPRDVVVVADHARDFCLKDFYHRCIVDKRTNEFILPRFVEECHFNGISKQQGIAVQQQSDCGGSNGTSGASILDSDLAHPTILGIFTAIDESKNEVAQQRRNGTPIDHEYSSDEQNPHMTVSTPVSGAFADAIQRAAASESN